MLGYGCFHNPTDSDTDYRIFNVRMWSSGVPVTADTAEDLISVSIGKGYSRGRAGPCIVCVSSLKHWLTMGFWGWCRP